MLVVDYPSKDVPETLARGGFAVTVQGGPGPEDYVDYELQYEKAFVSPIMKITEAIGWQTEKRASLMDFL